jgi:hypothetical protein
MMISKFWKALDELTDGGSSHWGWQQRLSDEWQAVAPFLPATGKMAASLPCPNPGGAGCPRQVIIHGDGTASAICGDNPKACQSLEVTRDALRIHALNRRSFAEALVKAMELQPPIRNPAQSFIQRLGTRERAAGLGVPVFLCIPGATPKVTPQDLDEILETPTPVVLLCPTVASLPSTVAEPLRRHGVTIMPLDTNLLARGPGKFALTPQGDTIMQDLLGQLGDMAAQAKGPQRAWELPPGTTWEDMTIRFTAAAWINVTVKGVTRAFEPDAFDLRNTKKQETTVKEAWKFFLALAVGNGRHVARLADSQGTPLLQKNKQALSKALIAAFGLEGDPIKVVKGEYVTRFVLSADDLRQGRQGQSSTKFR